jgi:IS605 OrfB family transposase
MIQLNLTESQKILINRDLLVSNYVYNKTINYIIENKIKVIKKLELRNLLVTTNSKTTDPVYIKFTKDIIELKKKISLDKNNISLREELTLLEDMFKDAKKTIQPVRNENLKDWEMLTHKDIRAGSVFEACKNISTNKMLVKTGKIKRFKMSYRKKKTGKYSMCLLQSMFNLVDGNIYLTDRSLKKDNLLIISKCNQEKLKKFTNVRDSKIIKKHGKYYFALVVDNPKVDFPKTDTFIGLDPGVNTFLTGFTNEETIDFNFNTSILDDLDKKKARIKNRKYIDKNDRRKLVDSYHPKTKRKRIRKKTLTKIDNRKSNIIDNVHWQFANTLTAENRHILIEKFDSQKIVKNGKNNTLNRRINNLKPYQFRQRLIYKAQQRGKQVIVVNAFNTTKTCSSCGFVKNDVGTAKIYTCDSCGQVFGRDPNAAKNNMMKGMVGYVSSGSLLPNK